MHHFARGKEKLVMTHDNKMTRAKNPVDTKSFFCFWGEKGSIFLLRDFFVLSTYEGFVKPKSFPLTFERRAQN